MPGQVITRDDKAAIRQARAEFDQRVAMLRREFLQRLQHQLDFPDYVVRQYFDNPDAD